MPQPLSAVNAGAKVELCNIGDYSLEQRPELLRLSMRVIAAWSILEAFLSGVFVEMLGENAKLGTAIYTSLLADSAKLATFRAAADVSLAGKDRERELLEAILKIFKSLGLHRHKVAHWLWGLSPDIPDGILLADPSVMIQFHMDRSTPGATAIPDKNLIYVYKAKDFEAAINGIERLAKHCMNFRLLLTAPHVPDLAGALYRQLTHAPDIAQALSHLRKDQKTPQGGQPQPPPIQPQAADE